MQVASIPLGLVSTQATLVSRSTRQVQRDAILPESRGSSRAIVDLARIIERRGLLGIDKICLSFSPLFYSIIPPNLTYYSH